MLDFFGKFMFARSVESHRRARNEKARQKINSIQDKARIGERNTYLHNVPMQ